MRISPEYRTCPKCGKVSFFVLKGKEVEFSCDCGYKRVYEIQR